MDNRAKITELLADPQDAAAVAAVYPLIYDHLKRIAHRQLRGERGDHTLNSTALVHEAFLKLVDQDHARYQSRAHFLSIAALAMRRILVSYARRRAAEKRGGDVPFVTFDDGLMPKETRAQELLDLDDALTRLESLNARQAQIVTFRFYADLTYEEIADLLGDSVHAVRYDWRVARAWLKKEMNDGGRGRESEGARNE
jgi:RNA polymerase sigma factor (TIGR02999 family)